MWTLQQSRNKFEARFRGNIGAQYASTLRLLDAAGAATTEGRVPTLLAWTRSMNASNARRTRSSADVYCGLVKTGDLGTSERLRDGKGAWIAIAERFVRLAESLADVFPAFESAWPSLRHSQHAVHALDAARLELFRHVGRDDEGDHQNSPSQSHLWQRHQELNFVKPATQAAVRWVIAHELAHQVPDSEDVAAASDACRLLLRDHRLWPSSQDHRDEIIRDYLATTYVLNSGAGVHDLMTAIAGSYIGTLALGFDGWFADGSAPSDTHPSPFLRLDALWFFWLKHLESLRDEQWARHRLPDPHGLDDMADFYAYAKWCAGAYRSERRGPVVDQDAEMLRNAVLRSADPPGFGLPDQVRTLLQMMLSSLPPKQRAEMEERLSRLPRSRRL